MAVTVMDTAVASGGAPAGSGTLIVAPAPRGEVSRVSRRREPPGSATKRPLADSSAPTNAPTTSIVTSPAPKPSDRKRSMLGVPLAPAPEPTPTIAALPRVVPGCQASVAASGRGAPVGYVTR